MEHMLFFYVCNTFYNPLKKWLKMPILGTAVVNPNIQMIPQKVNMKQLLKIVQHWVANPELLNAAVKI
jgi:hypothetical protein